MTVATQFGAVKINRRDPPFAQEPRLIVRQENKTRRGQRFGRRDRSSRRWERLGGLDDLGKRHRRLAVVELNEVRDGVEGVSEHGEDLDTFALSECEDEVVPASSVGRRVLSNARTPRARQCTIALEAYVFVQDVRSRTPDA